MRILCLHGHGTSADIFKIQTSAFRSQLDSSYIFDFVNAPFYSSPAAGITLFFDPPYYTFFPAPTIASLRACHEWFLQYLTTHGPYDAVCGFSQGCSVIGSFLLYHAAERPLEPLPFKSAIFICGGLPFPVLEDLGLPIPQRAREINDQTSIDLRVKANSVMEFASAAGTRQWQKGVGLWDATESLVHDPTVLPDASDVYGMDFREFPQELRIGIPTVHILGSKDPRWPAGMQLAYFCDEGRRKIWDHGGGHDIPRTTAVSKEIAGLVRWAEEEAGKRNLHLGI